MHATDVVPNFPISNKIEKMFIFANTQKVNPNACTVYFLNR